MDWQNFVNTFWDNTRDGLALGSIYALIALGYTLVYGVLRLINFANSEVFMLGTFGSFVALWILDVPQGGQQMSALGLFGVLALSFALSVLFSAGTAVLLERVAYRPLRRRGAPRLVFLISAIGCSFVLAEAVGAFGAKRRDEYALPRVFNPNHEVFRIGGTIIQVRHVVVIASALVMMGLLSVFVSRTRLGRGMRAVAQDSETARILGVNVDQVVLLTFLIGGIMAGGAAFLYTLYLPATRYSVGFLLGIKSFTAAVLGGIGNIKGALFGGLLLGVVEKWGAGLFGGKWLDVIAFIVLVIVLMFRPTGLLGESLGRVAGMNEVAGEARQAITDLNDGRRERRMAWSARWRRLPRNARWSVAVLGVAALYVVPLTKPPLLDTPDVDFVSLLGSSVVPFVLAALGLNVVVGLAGLLDLGYVGFYAIGAYTVGILTSQHATLPWLVALPVAIGVAMLFGVLLGAPTLRLRGDYLAIVTLGFGEIIRISAQNLSWLGAAEGISAIDRPPSVGPLKFGALNNNAYWILGLTLILLVVFLLRRIENSRVGRAWTAIREDEDAAELMGVPTFQFKLWAFAIGAAVGGLAGAFYAGKNITIYPSDFDIANSILFLAAVVLGGPGNMWGVMLGGFAVAYLPERFRFVADKRYLFFGVALVVMMIFRPQGLLPRRQRSEELHHAQDQTDFQGLGGADLADQPVVEGPYDD